MTDQGPQEGETITAKDGSSFIVAKRIDNDPRAQRWPSVTVELVRAEARQPLNTTAFCQALRRASRQSRKRSRADVIAIAERIVADWKLLLK